MIVFSRISRAISRTAQAAGQATAATWTGLVGFGVLIASIWLATDMVRAAASPGQILSGVGLVMVFGLVGIVAIRMFIRR